MKESGSPSTDVLTASELTGAEGEVRQELEEALGSAAFGQSESLKRFLRYVVEAKLEGREGELKELVLGSEVFDRGEDFDPRIDPIVRVQATRLRAKLREFYHDRPASALRIELPKGSYVPSFRRALGAVEPAVSVPGGETRDRRLSWVAAPAAVLVVLAALGLWRSQGDAPSSASGDEVHSLLVLPFSDMSPGGDHAYYGDGLAEEITTALASIQGLAVTPRTTAFALRERSIAEVSAQAGVDAVLQGSVRQSAETLRITAQLIRTADGAQLWAESYDEASGNVFGVQEDIARDVARAVERELLPGSEVAPEPGAYEAYLIARFELARATPASIERAVDRFEHAVELDPDYGRAYAGLVQALVVDVLWGFAAPAETRARAREASNQALSLAEDQSEALAAAAAYELIYEWDRETTAQLLARADDADPQGAEVHTVRGLLLASDNRIDEAIAELSQGAAIEPPTPFRYYLLATVLSYAERRAQALEVLESLWELAPDFALGHLLEASILRDAGEFDSARESLDTFDRMVGPTPLGLAARGVLLAREGRDSEAREVLATLQSERSESYVPPDLVARVLVAVGDLDEAFATLESARHEGSLPVLLLTSDPVFGPLRSDPRFPALLQGPEGDGS